MECPKGAESTDSAQPPYRRKKIELEEDDEAKLQKGAATLGKKAKINPLMVVALHTRRQLYTLYLHGVSIAVHVQITDMRVTS